MIIIFRTIHNILISIFLLGCINLYNIVKYGITFNLPTTIFHLNSTKFEFIENIINLNESNIKLIIIISFSIFFIINFSSLQNSNPNQKKIFSIEFELLIGFGLIGIIIILLSNDLFLIYLGLELYSFTIYLLILIKETINTRRISIVYLIISSISSGFLLISFFYFYKYTGSLNLFWINNIINNINTLNNTEKFNFYILFFSLLFKLGTIPFSYWVIRVYGIMEKRILLYQLIIPKLVFFLIFLKFLNLLSSSSFLSSFAYLFFFISIFSLLFSSIGGLFQFQFNSLLSYSSILNISFLLLSLSIILGTFNFSNWNILIKSFPELFGIISEPSLWIIFQFFFIYFFNLISLFSFFSLFFRSSNVFKFSNFLLFPFFFISFFISLFSFIGFPPLAGFYAKFSLFFSLFTTTSTNYINISTIALFFFLLSTIISSFFYFKFLYSSSIIKFEKEEINLNPLNLLISSHPLLASYLLSFSSLFLVLYPFFFYFFFPFFFISF